MSRGLGKREREILTQLTDRPMPLGGQTRSERVAIRRAAKSLERRGLADLFVLWNASNTGGETWIVQAGAVTKDGRPWKSLSVASAPTGALATHKRPRLRGSIRNTAEEEGVSASTIRRDFALIKATGLDITLATMNLTQSWQHKR